LRAQGETDLPLDHALHQQAYDREHRQGRNPFGLREPYGTERRQMLAPPKARLPSGILLLIGMKNRTLRTALGAHGRGQDSPAVFSVPPFAPQIDEASACPIFRDLSRPY
jgi:hypothetical protein